MPRRTHVRPYTRRRHGTSLTGGPVIGHDRTTPTGLRNIIKETVDTAAELGNVFPKGDPTRESMLEELTDETTAEITGIPHEPELAGEGTAWEAYANEKLDQASHEVKTGRRLTRTQMQVLQDWFDGPNEGAPVGMSWEADDLPYEHFKLLEDIYDYETMYQDVTNYVHSMSDRSLSL